MKKLLFIVMFIALAAIVSSFKVGDSVSSAPILHPEYVGFSDGFKTHECHTTYDDNGVVLLCVDLATEEVLIENGVELIHVYYVFECECFACGHEWEQDPVTDQKACVHCPVCDEKCDWDYCIWSCGDGYCTRDRRE